MKIYNLTLEQNKMVSAIINDLTKPYKVHANTKQYELWCNKGICKVRQRAEEKGLLLNDTDCKLSLVDLRAIIKGGEK